MSTLKTTLLVGLLLLTNACSVGTVTASSRMAGGGGGGGGLGGNPQSNSASPVVQKDFDRHVHVADRAAGPRDSAGFRLDADCKRCGQ
jgi:hypothetical protein